MRILFGILIGLALFGITHKLYLEPRLIDQVRFEAMAAAGP